MLCKDDLELTKNLSPIAFYEDLELKGVSKNGKSERAIIYDRPKEKLFSLLINGENEVRYENRKISLFDFTRK